MRNPKNMSLIWMGKLSNRPIAPVDADDAGDEVADTSKVSVGVPV